MTSILRGFCFSYSLSLIDALDTLLILGNHSEYRRVVNIVLQKTDFNQDINVSVFETNIRGRPIINPVSLYNCFKFDFNIHTSVNFS